MRQQTNIISLTIYIKHNYIASKVKTDFLNFKESTTHKKDYPSKTDHITENISTPAIFYNSSVW